MRQIIKILFLLIIFIFFSKISYSRGSSLLNVYKYMQCDASWGSNQLGNCVGYNICDWGCAITCTAMLLKSHGTNANPGSLNTYLKNNNGYDPNCNIYWGVACGYPGSSMAYSGTQGYSLSVIKNKIDQNDPVIVEVALPGMHFVVVRGYTNNGTAESDFVVYDPLQVNERNLSQYSKVGLRVYNNVIQSSSVSVSFKFNGTELPAPPNEWKIWKYPPIPSNYYTLSVSVTGRPSGSAGYWDLFVYRPNGDSIDAALNVQTDVLTQAFNVSTSNTWFSTNGIYKFKVMNRLTPRTVWAVSNQFYISSVPTLSVGAIPNNVNVGQSVTFSWIINGGIPNLPQGGWIGNIQIQWHQGVEPNSNPLNVLAMRPVNSNPYNFIVPSSNGGEIPGSNFRLSGSNPEGSSIPPGYVYAYTNYFNIGYFSSISLVNNIKPNEFVLQNNYPNPFNVSTNIKFDIKESSFTVLKIYDILGKEIETLVNENLSPGTYSIDWNALQYSSGIYLYKLQADEFVDIKRMTLIK